MTGHVPVFGNVSPLTAKRVSSFSFLCACHFFCICNMMYGGLQINNTLCVTTQAVRFLFAILCFCSSDNVTPLYFQNSWMYVIYVNEFLFIYLFMCRLIWCTLSSGFWRIQLLSSSTLKNGIASYNPIHDSFDSWYNAGINMTEMYESCFSGLIHNYRRNVLRPRRLFVC